MTDSDRIVKHLIENEASMDEEKRIYIVLPQLIKIVSEGDAVERAARFLISQGWGEEDVWREIKNLTASSIFTGSLQNTVHDLIRNGQVWSNAHDWAASMKMDARRLKRQG